MLRMIIADDEFIVRDGLRHVINWSNFGIEIIAEAKNGQEAYDLCISMNPDILLTDIRMPFMDGLEVASKLKENGCESRIIIVSGIQDFNYAKTALSINAEGYILKPVSIDELETVVRKVVNSIDLEKNRDEKYLKLKSQLHENLPIIREKFLRNIVTGMHQKWLDISQKIDFLQLPFSHDEKILVAVLQVDEHSENSKFDSEEDLQLLNFAIQNVSEEIIQNESAGICFWMDENEFIMIFNQKSIYTETYMFICEEIQKCLNKFLEIYCSIGLGCQMDMLTYAHSSYKEARIALQHRFYTGRNSILNFLDIGIQSKKETPSEIIFESNFYDIENRLLNYMKLGDQLNVSKCIDSIFDIYIHNQKPPVEYVQTLAVEIITLATRSIYELDVSLENITESHQSIIANIFSTKDIFNLKKYLQSLFINITDYFREKFLQKNNSSVLTIKNIITSRYAEELSVASIAKEVYLSPNYISLIFKQETGETITEFLTKIRIEQAKLLLTSTNLKILEVAERVGYENTNYFSTVFKKYTGVHPQKFRSDMDIV